MVVQSSIEEKLNRAFSPTYLQVLNESSQHSVPLGSETHFRLEVVSDQFENLSRLERSRKIHALLSDELKQGVHALSLKLYTPSEWKTRNGFAGEASPACHGGSKSKN